MKRGEKVLLAIGALWTLGFSLLLVLKDSEKDDLQNVMVGLLVVWTVVGFAWLLLYGRHER
jgi:hypothetical protein